MKTFDRNKAKNWLVSTFNTTHNMFGTSPRFERYYLWSDNVLVPTAIKDWNPDVYNKSINRVVELKTKYNITCKTPWTLVCDPDVITRVKMTNPFPIRHVEEIFIADSPLSTGQTSDGKPIYRYSDYGKDTTYTENSGRANIEFLRTLYYHKKGDSSRAKYYYEKGLKFWDGLGFKDNTFPKYNQYEVYKYALYKYVQRKTGYRAITPPCAIAAMSQNDLGGVQTHYVKQTIDDYKAGRPYQKISSFNTETTSLCLLAGFSSMVI